VGRASFSGARNPGAAGQWAGVYHPGSYSHSNPVVATSLSGSSYTISLTAPLTAGDVVYVGAEQVIGDVDVNSNVERSATACPTPPAPQAPAPAPATKAQVLAGLKQSLAKATKDLKSVDATKLAKQGALPVGFTFLVPGTVKFTLTAPGAKAKKASAAKTKKKAAKALVIAAGTKVATTPGRTAVSLKLTAAGRKLLRRGKPVNATLSAAFTPAGGGTAQKAQASLKIKRVKTKAHRRH
jgi:hypothetical protein